MAAIEDRFQAAVNVIKGLPKNGPYQPSTGMMLKFYGLFKQATEGPCDQKKPGFWDIVGRAKWDAWADNRHLSKDQAMQRYVENLQEIIETMSFTENVQNFVGSLSGLENINLDELDLISPGMRELAESHPNSPFNSRTNSPQHGASANSNGQSAEEASTNRSTSVQQLAEELPPIKSTTTALANGHMTNGGQVVMNGFVEQKQHEPPLTNTTTSSMRSYPTSNGITAAVEPSDDEYDDPYDLNHDLTIALSQNSDLLKQIQATVMRMNTDISSVCQRMSNLERTLQDIRQSRCGTIGNGNNRSVAAAAAASRRHPTWWPFVGISPAWFVLLVLWPFVFKRFARMLETSSRRR